MLFLAYASPHFCFQRDYDMQCLLFLARAVTPRSLVCVIALCDEDALLYLGRFN